MSPTEKFWGWFLERVQAVPDVVYCEMSDGSRALHRWEADSRGMNIYPGVYLLRPQYAPRKLRNGMMLAVFHYNFRVGVQKPNNEAQNADAALNEAEIIAAKIQREMIHFSKNNFGGIMGEFLYQNEMYVPIRMLELEPDYVWGYEVSGQVGMPVHDLGLFC